MTKSSSARVVELATRARRLEMPELSAAARRARRKFLRYFSNGYADETFQDWERGYKLTAARRFREELGTGQIRALIRRGDFQQVAARAVAIEARTNLLFSFEKMAVRDAVSTKEGARDFALGLLELTRSNANERSFDFHYQTRPNWATYQSLLQFAQAVRRDTRDLKPRDMIDLQSFIWVQGSDEYP